MILNSAADLCSSIEGPTSTIHFCGFGGSTEGARRARLRPLLAINHDQHVVEIHQRNYPGVVTDCADLSQTDPEKYAPTDIYQGSPECTNHSLAAGARRKKRRKQIDLFEERGTPILNKASDGAERSRATMWCVQEHAEVHQYPIVLVENVIDAARWHSFDLFLESMRRIGYRRQRLLSVNASFIGGTPQCRDRLHIAFVHDEAPMPNLDLNPPAPCPTCRGTVESEQLWTSPTFADTGFQVGEYGVQYVFRCRQCKTPVVPYFRSALNAIDTSIEAPTIAELGSKLSETMKIRIQMGIEKFGHVPMVLTNNCTTHHGRVRSILDVAFTQTGSNTTAVLLPPEDCGEEELPDPVWVDAVQPRRSDGIRSAVRSHSAVIDEGKLTTARRLYAGARAAKKDLGAWRYRTLTIPERLKVQGFAEDHYVAGNYRQKHLMVGNANPPTVEAELAVRAGAALRPDLYPGEIRPLRAA